MKTTAGGKTLFYSGSLWSSFCTLVSYLCFKWLWVTPVHKNKHKMLAGLVSSRSNSSAGCNSKSHVCTTPDIPAFVFLFLHFYLSKQKAFSTTFVFMLYPTYLQSSLYETWKEWALKCSHLKCIWKYWQLLSRLKNGIS